MHRRFAKLVIAASNVKQVALAARLLRVAETINILDEFKNVEEEVSNLKRAIGKHRMNKTMETPEAKAMVQKFNELLPKYNELYEKIKEMRQGPPRQTAPAPEPKKPQTPEDVRRREEYLQQAKERMKPLSERQ